MTYDAEGTCHNAEPGTFGHECGKPAVWIGTSAKGNRIGFCADCKERGWEAKQFTGWVPAAGVGIHLTEKEG